MIYLYTMCLVKERDSMKLNFTIARFPYGLLTWCCRGKNVSSSSLVGPWHQNGRCNPDS
uniref:Uncharacterized protein n=1 Tax=Arundo donax TaxID=35708 RepID=A0A0A9DZC7_ARUDO